MWLRKTLEICRTGGACEPSDAAILLGNLAVLQSQTGRAGLAARHLEQAASILEQELGSRHPELVRPLNNSAILLLRAGKPGEAAPLLERALAIGQATFGPAHPVVADLLLNYAATLRALHRKGEARTLEKRAQRIRTSHDRQNLVGFTIDASEPAAFRPIR